MKPQTIVSEVLLAFVAVSAGWMIFKPGPTPVEETTVPAPAPAPPVLPDRVVVYYFHTTYRCPTCHKIEEYTKEAVESGFAQELRNGRVEFRVLNIDEPANAHFIQDYQLNTKSVVVVDMTDGKQARWNNLTKIWELTTDQPAFTKYIQDAVGVYLLGK